MYNFSFEKHWIIAIFYDSRIDMTETAPPPSQWLIGPRVMPGGTCNTAGIVRGARLALASVCCCNYCARHRLQKLYDKKCTELACLTEPMDQCGPHFSLQG